MGDPPIPYSAEAERAVLGCMLSEPESVISKVAEALTRDDFFMPESKVIFSAICTQFRLNLPVDVLSIHLRLEEDKTATEVGSPGILAELLTAFGSHLHVGTYIQTVADRAMSRRLYEMADGLKRDVIGGQFAMAELLDRVDRSFKSVMKSAGDRGVDRARIHRFDAAKPPKRTEPVLWIGTAGIAKAGDLVAIQAQSKAGKSSFISAIIGRLMAGAGSDRDFLGVQGCNPGNLPVYHFDTEQAPEDHFDLGMRAMRRAGLEQQPSWFVSDCVTALTFRERRKMFVDESRSLHREHGGMCALFLDGTADLIADVNDAEEANGLIDELFALAIELSCPLISVIHENHSSQDGKTRGHLGSQLMRKAASNLRLSKDESGIIQVWGDRVRRGHIAKGSGPHFVWDEEAGIHVSCDAPSKEPAKVRNVEGLTNLANQILSVGSVMRYTELWQEIAKLSKCSESTAKRKVLAMQNQKLISYILGMYSLNQLKV